MASDMEKRIRAVLLHSPGSRTMVEFLKDFEAHFPELPKPTLAALKTMHSFIEVTYSSQFADFLIALKVDSMEDKLSSLSKSSEENCNQSDEGQDFGGGGDNVKPLTANQLAELKPDYNGVYTLCFPKTRNYFIRPHMIKSRFQPYKIDGYSITPFYVFVRFNNRDIALEVWQKFRVTMDLRPAQRRLDRENNKEKRNSKWKNTRAADGGDNSHALKQSTAKSEEVTKKDREDIYQKSFDQYRTENESKLSHLQQELFTVNHKLQDMVVENAKTCLALQTRISNQDEKITKLQFTVHSLQDSLQQAQLQTERVDSSDIDK